MSIIRRAISFCGLESSSRFAASLSWQWPQPTPRAASNITIVGFNSSADCPRRDLMFRYTSSIFWAVPWAATRFWLMVPISTVLRTTAVIRTDRSESDSWCLLPSSAEYGCFPHSARRSTSNDFARNDNARTAPQQRSKWLAAMRRSRVSGDFRRLHTAVTNMQGYAPFHDKEGGRFRRRRWGCCSQDPSAGLVSVPGHVGIVRIGDVSRCKTARTRASTGERCDQSAISGRRPEWRAYLAGPSCSFRRTSLAASIWALGHKCTKQAGERATHIFVPACVRRWFGDISRTLAGHL